MSSKKDSPGKGKIVLTTETEHMLYERYYEEREEREKLLSLVNDQRNQIEILQQQLKCLAENEKTKSAPADGKETSAQRDYTTDEDELARETEWIRQKSRKKRKLNTSPIQDDSSNEDERRPKSKGKKTPLPPPIVVDGVKDYQHSFDLLSGQQPTDSFTIKMMSSNTVKINTINEESYRAITKVLNLNQFLWHSYEDKQTRPIRVMAKKLHFTCKPERIIEDLLNKGFKILEAVNKLRWRTKEPLNMFMLTFATSEEISKIYSIKTILGCSVEIQSIKSTKLVPQCKKCQAYGHTQKYCSKEPRCVKCTGKHHTIDCTKPATQKPKCVHCGDPHPANYRGCTIAKEIQSIRNKILKKPNLVLQRNTTAQIQEASNKKKTRDLKNESTTKKTTYAQVAAKDTAKSIHGPHYGETNEKKLDDILKIMMSLDERLKKIENSTKPASFRPSK